MGILDSLKRIFSRQHEPKVTVKEIGVMVPEPDDFGLSAHRFNQVKEVGKKEKPKVIILDDNPLSIAAYLEEYGEPKHVDALLQDLRRERRNREIAEKNQKRQRSMMGSSYGGRAKFRPRSHYEKATWNMAKKPADGED